MNVLFYRYGSICEEDFINAFNEYGITIDEVTEEMHNKKLRADMCVQLLNGWLQNGNYSFVFSINFFPVVSDVCNIYHIPYMCIIVDSPVLELYSHSLKNQYNRVFLFDRALYNEFHSVNPNGIFHIPLAANVKNWNKIIESDNTDRFHYDISFVGSLYTEKCPYNSLSDVPEYLEGWLKGIIEAQLKVYGYYFVDELITDEIADDFIKHVKNGYAFPEGYNKDYKALVSQFYIGNKISSEERVRIFKLLSTHFNVDIYTGSDTSGIPNIHNHGLARSKVEMPLIFRRSKISLNITSKAIRSGLPLRIFDIMGCGGFVLTNYQAELPENFTVGEHLDVYESFEDLCDKTDYYLNHEHERTEIARAGYEYVRDNHTYVIRLGQMIVQALGDR